MQTVLFVCTGNTCRSPMAEAIARTWLARGDRADAADWFVASAGVAAIDGAPVSRETIVALEAVGIEHEGSAKRLTAEMIRKAQLVLCMTHHHAAVARELVSGEPQQVEKILPLDPRSDVDDPIGRGQGAYDALAQRLLQLLPSRLGEVLV